jgi:hypothetical protein
MMPDAYVLLDMLPLTENGKVNRHALPETESLGSSDSYGVLADEDEATLSEIWRAVLGLAHVTRDSNFFACGGNSLSAVRLVEQVINEFHIEFHTHSVFKYPKFRLMADHIRRIRIEHGVPPLFGDADLDTGSV